MRTAQRGSVLLTAIAGILILAVIGTVMVSLMTSSVMTLVDGKETLQATYLAESGKEIVRSRTAKMSGGELMSAAQALEALSKENGGKGLAIADKGFIKLSLYPSWFRWYDDKLNTTASGWFPNALSGKVELLVLSQSGGKRYAYDASNHKFGNGNQLPDHEAADVYLIGRVSDGGSIVYNEGNRTLTVRTSSSDFDWFPQTGGLIGLTEHRNLDMSVPSAHVDTQRFTYDQKNGGNGTYTFTNLTSLTDDPVSQDTFKNKDLVLGQYFRVVCEATTTNGARAAMVWHTNGRSSLRFETGVGGGEGEMAVTPDVAGTLSPPSDSPHPENELHKEMQELFGNNVTQHNQGHNSGYDVIGLAGGYALITGALQPSVKNHFLLKEKNHAATTDYWFASIAKKKTSFTDEKGGVVQISVFPWPTSDKLFAGVLMRLKILKNDEKENSNAYDLQDGVAGLGMGFAYGTFTLLESGKVHQSSINPALLPGFEWRGDAFYANAAFSAYAQRFYKRDSPFSLAYHIPPMVILWAYDDGNQSLSDTNNGSSYGAAESEPPNSLRWLAVSKLDTYDIYRYGLSEEPWSNSFFSRIVAYVHEVNGVNEIRGWVASHFPPKEYALVHTGYPDPETHSWETVFNPNKENLLGYVHDNARQGLKPSEGIVWPVLTPSERIDSKRDVFTMLQWDAVNSGTYGEGQPIAAYKENDSVQGKQGRFTVLTGFATGKGTFARTGFFQGVYSASETGQNNNQAPAFRNFAAGTVTLEGGGEKDAPGLTPGITN